MTIACRAAVCFVALMIAACASSPVTLVVLPPPPAPARSGDQGSNLTVRVREVRLPGYLESFPVVTGRAGNALIVSPDTEWGERLTQGVSRVLRDALSQRLGAPRVLIEGDRRVPDADLMIEFLSLDPYPGALDLDAKWFFTCTASGRSGGGRTRLQVAMGSATPAAVAAGTTDALARLADALAAEVRCDHPA